MDSSILKISGVIRDYAWGGFNYIPAFLGITDPMDKPSAEYWLGAHPSAPAKVIDCDKADTLDAFQEETGEQPLSFLMKILDVRQMLSIQVHPSIKQAIEGYDREEQAGISLNAPNRNYKDRNHKPELAYALGEFWMLHGLRPESAIRDTFKHYPSCAPLASILDESGMAGLIASSVSDDPVIAEVVTNLLTELEKDPGIAQKSHPGFWIKRWMNSNPDAQRGILMILLMNLVELKAGDAIYQPQGLIHAYLEGRNIEIMANSDNVLRAGLTPKFIDADELVKVSLLEATDPDAFKVNVTRDEFGIRNFDTPYKDFLLSDIEIPPNSVSTLNRSRAQILLFFSGEHLVVSEPGGNLQMCQGESCYVRGDAEITLINESACTAHLFIGS